MSRAFASAVLVFLILVLATPYILRTYGLIEDLGGVSIGVKVSITFEDPEPPTEKP